MTIMLRSSSSRRHNKWQRDRPELSMSLNSLPRSHDEADGSWIVQQVRGNSSGKVYTCPGCGQELPAGTPHTVAWRSAGDFGYNTGVGARRHWHTSCFNARSRRG